MDANGEMVMDRDGVPTLVSLAAAAAAEAHYELGQEPGSGHASPKLEEVSYAH